MRGVVGPAALGALLLALGCEKETRSHDPIIAEIGGRAFTLSLFERYVKAAAQEEAAFTGGELKAALLDQFIEEQLLLRAAEEEGIVVEEAELKALGQKAASGAPEEVAPAPAVEGETPALPAGRGDLASHLRLRKLIGERILSGVAVSPEEIAAYYEERRALYRRPEAVDISQILLETREEAEQIRKELAARPDRFEEMAGERSVGPEAWRGGQVGTFRRGELPPSFEEEVFRLRKGQISGVVQTDFGFHIFRLNRRSPASTLSLEEAKDAIRVELLRQKSDAAMALYLGKLRARYPVKVFAERLGFPYLDRNGKREAKKGSGEGGE